MPVILAFNIPPEKQTKLRMLCALVKAQFKPVAPADYSLTLGELILGKSAAPEANVDADTFNDEMLVIAGLAGQKFNLFLHDFKRMGIPPIPLKAMLTATNAEWTPVQLHKELCAERDAFARGESAHESK